MDKLNNDGCSAGSWLVGQVTLVRVVPSFVMSDLVDTPSLDLMAWDPCNTNYEYFLTISYYFSGLGCVLVEDIYYIVKLQKSLDI